MNIVVLFSCVVLWARSEAEKKTLTASAPKYRRYNVVVRDLLPGLCTEYDYQHYYSFARATRLRVPVERLHGDETEGIVGGLLANLTSRLLHSYPELKTGSSVTEEEWDKIVLHYEELRNSTVAELHANSKEASDSADMVKIFEDTEQRLMHWGLCENILPSIASSPINASANDLKTVCDNIRPVFHELPSIPMPAEVWKAKWHRLTASALSQKHNNATPDLIQLLLRMKIFQMKKSFLRIRSLDSMMVAFTHEVCKMSFKVGLDSADVGTVMTAFDLYQMEDAVWGSKQDWNLTDFENYNTTRWASLNELRLLAMKSNADKVAETFDEVIAQNTMCSFASRKEYVEVIMRKAHEYEGCEKLPDKIVRKLAPLQEHLFPYVAMRASAVKRIEILIQRAITEMESSNDVEPPTSKHHDIQRAYLEDLKITGEGFFHVNLLSRIGVLAMTTANNSHAFDDRAKACGMHDNYDLLRAILRSRSEAKRMCKLRLRGDRMVKRMDFLAILLVRYCRIDDWVIDSQSAIWAVPFRDAGQVECFYRSLESDFVNKHRQPLLALIQTDDTGFIELMRSEVRSAAQLAKLSGNETEQVVSFIDESLSAPPPHFLPQQNITISEIRNAYERSVTFIAAFIEKCLAASAIKSKTGSISKHLGDIFSQKVPDGKPHGFVCNDMLTDHETTDRKAYRLPSSRDEQ